jgi:hypothetical protein
LVRANTIPPATPAAAVVIGSTTLPTVFVVSLRCGRRGIFGMLGKLGALRCGRLSVRVEPMPCDAPCDCELPFAPLVRPRDACVVPFADEPELLLELERDVERERPDDRLLPFFAREVVAAILITSVWVFPR